MLYLIRENMEIRVWLSNFRKWGRFEVEQDSESPDEREE